MGGEGWHEEMSARETPSHDPGPGLCHYVGSMTGRRYSLRDSGSWLSRPALSSRSSVSMASGSAACIEDNIPRQFLTNLPVSCVTHSTSLSLKQTKRHQLSHGPAWLECLPVSWSVSCCKLWWTSLATTVIMQPVVATIRPELPTQCWWQHGITASVSSDAL